MSRDEQPELFYFQKDGTRPLASEGVVPQELVFANGSYDSSFELIRSGACLGSEPDPSDRRFRVVLDQTTAYAYAFEQAEEHPEYEELAEEPAVWTDLREQAFSQLSRIHSPTSSLQPTKLVSGRAVGPGDTPRVSFVLHLHLAKS